MNSVEMRSAVKSYGRAQNKNFVLNNLSMTVSAGSIYGLVGSSGCGKTTLLSCILGMISLDSGNIEVLGQQTNAKEVLRVGHKIGYMPQEAALVGELTVKETVYYFGNIFQMEAKRLKKRFEMLKDLLELPPDNLRLEDCSGGEQRRVSFASATVHEPELLVLDEPTAGLDPLLREKIWNFLFHATRTSKLAVIVTTHYTAEAQKSDRVGLMRNGVLLAEGSPSHIMSISGTESLDEAFLELCINPKTLTLSSENLAEEETKEDGATVEELSHSPTKENSFRLQIVKELVKKHYRKFHRQPALFAFTMIVPIVQLLLLYSVSGFRHGIKVAVVNEELQDLAECLKIPDFSSVNGSCHFEQASCLLLNQLEDDIIDKRFYEGYEEAYQDLKHGRVKAILHVKKDFSRQFTQFLHDESLHDPSAVSREVIEVDIDGVDWRLSNDIKKQILTANNLFIRTLFSSCNMSDSFLSSPLSFEEPIYGSFSYKFGPYMIHIIIAAWSFFFAANLTITPFITDRKEGFWNRTLLAGVSFTEMMVAQILAHLFLVIFVYLELVAYAFIEYGTSSVQHFVTLFFLLMAIGFSGMFTGIGLSTICPNIISANVLMMALCLSLVVVSGLFWPLELMPPLMQALAYCLPLTSPSLAIRDIMLKQFTFLSPSVLRGFLVAFVWMILGIASGSWVLKLRKFSRNTNRSQTKST